MLVRFETDGLWTPSVASRWSRYVAAPLAVSEADSSALNEGLHGHARQMKWKTIISVG